MKSSSIIVLIKTNYIIEFVVFELTSLDYYFIILLFNKDLISFQI